jgi:uncharacterized protein (TIGR03067 family)
MMKAVALSFVAGVILLVGGQADETTLKKEKARFKGAWKIAKFESPKGENEELKGAEVVFDAEGGLELRHNGETKKQMYKLNPAAKPHEIEIIHENDKTMRGIYKLEKDTLKICLCADPSSDKRPTEFAVKDGDPHILVTLERAK